MASSGPCPPRAPLLLAEDPALAAAQVAQKYTALTAKAAFNPTQQQLDYTPDLRSLLPDEVWGTSIGGGNPFALGRPRPGAYVADLGCGAGVDLCIAAALVGGAGRVLGVDSNRALLERAQENVRLSAAGASGACADVILVEAPFDHPEHEALAPHFGRYDLVLSNGSLCLSFAMPRALVTALRLLRPGGRLQLFDLCQVDGTVPKSLGCWKQKS